MGNSITRGALPEAGWTRGPKRALLRWEHLRLSRYEREAWSRFHGHCVISPEDRARLPVAEEVLPKLRAKKPDANLLIAGSGATRRVRALHGGPISVIQRFEHIREAFAASRVLLAPMRISIGLQNKILEAMAMGIPVVTNGQGNAAIGGEHGRHLLVAEGPEALASAAHQLLTDPELSARSRAAAMQFVAERFSWEHAAAALDGVLFPAQAS